MGADDACSSSPDAAHARMAAASGNNSASRKGAPRALVDAIAAIPDYGAALDAVARTFSRTDALRDGSLAPLPGGDAEYDAACGRLREIRSALDAHLVEAASALGVSPGALRYRDVGRELFQLEVAEGLVRSVPGDWALMSRTKAVRRYWSPRVRVLAREHQEAEEVRAAASRSFYVRLLGRFSCNAEAWRAAGSALARLDALLSLAAASEAMAHPRVRPTVVDAPAAAVRLVGMRHPWASSSGRPMIPNSLELGGGAGRAAVLTGPNMGGKSTLLRQTCLAVVLAQVGCYVPAEACFVAGPVDRVLTRLGAHDNLVGGQSTFMVEMLDAARVLQSATPRSLVVLDELGRGTSTHDGAAIASAVLAHVAHARRPLALFATHYRPLAEAVLSGEESSASLYPGVRAMHMAVDDSERVTFLYRLAPGVSPRSFGTHVASLAGVPPAVVAAAEASIAAQAPSDNAPSFSARGALLHARLVALLCARAA